MKYISDGLLTLSEVSILLSLSECMEQQLHYDFNYADRVNETKQSYLVIAALM